MMDIEQVNSVFEQPWWMDIVAKGHWQEIRVDNKNGECIGRLPYAEMFLYGAKYIGVPPLTQQVGPWIQQDQHAKLVSRLKKSKQVTESILKQLENKKNVDLYLHREVQYVLPFIWNGYRVEPKITYVIRSLEDMDRVFSDMDAKVRNLIKSADKRVLITEQVSVEDLIRLLKDTFKKQQRTLPMDETILRQLYFETIQHRAGTAIGAIDKESNKLVAGAFFVYDQHTCYYLLGGKDYKVPIQGTQELLLWKGMQFASSVSKEFDFEGSMVPGIESFFRGFGGEPCIYYRIKKGGIWFNFLHWIKPFVKRFLGYK